jgi:hypothetical protein
LFDFVKCSGFLLFEELLNNKCFHAHIPCFGLSLTLNVLSVGPCEAVKHSWDCGGSTGIFLSVNSSTIVVIRGKRACFWGSIYLDVFGEEDRELK